MEAEIDVSVLSGVSGTCWSQRFLGLKDIIMT